MWGGMESPKYSHTILIHKRFVPHYHHLVKTRTDRKFPANPRTPTPAKVTIIITTQANQIFFSVLAFLSKGHQAPKTPTLHHNPVMEGNVLFSRFMEMIKLILLDPNENDL